MGTLQTVPLTLSSGLGHLSLWNAVQTLIVAAVVYEIWALVYRLTLHPLAGIPGPKWAAASWSYEFYNEVGVVREVIYPGHVCSYDNSGDQK